MIDSTQNYAFVDFNEKEQVIHGHEIINRAGWQGATTYYRNDGVAYDGDDFICLATNSNVIPGTNPTIWSYLVQIEGEGAPVINAGSDYIARSLGSLAYETALEAYALAQTGTNLIYIEAGTRSEADQYLQNLIVAETGSRIAGQDAIVAFVFGSIAVDLTNETGSRIAADLYESGTRSEADQYLQNLIVAETGSRITGQDAIVAFVFGSIAVDLTNETGSRIAADNAEAAARNQADQTIVTLVNETYILAASGTIPPPLSTLPDVSIPAPTVNQVLAFDGSVWVATDPPSQVAPGAFTLFLDNTPSGTLGYSQLLAIPSGVPEDIDLIVVGGTNPFVENEGYITGYLNRNRIDAGIWEFNTYAAINTPGEPANVVIEIYVAALNGVETFLFSGTSPAVTAVLSGTVTPFAVVPQLVTNIVTTGSYIVNDTDKLVAKYYGLRNASPPIILYLYHSGSAHDSHFHTPLALAHNDLGGLQGGNSTANQFYHIVLSEHDALQGTSGLPSDTNRFVTAESLTFEQGTRSEADQNLQNQIVAFSGSASGSLTVITADLAAEAGTRSFRDQFLQNQITTAQAAIVTEQGTRSEADQFLQTQVTTQTGVNVSQQAQLDSLFASLGVSFSGTFAWWMAQIRGGLTDTKLNVVNGIVSGYTESTFAWEDFEFYGTGSIGSGGFNKGTFWNGAGILTTYPVPGTQAEEGYAGLSDGPVTSIPVTNFYGWLGTASVGNGTLIGFSGSDAFNYATGTVVAGEISAGFGWTGTATIYTR